MPNRITQSVCRVEGCDKTKKKASGMCSMHRARYTRTGRLDKVVRARRPRYTASTGYVRIHDPQHNLADSTGYVYEHRMVLYAEIGPAEQRCAWCRCAIHWKPEPGQRGIDVDHFNAERADNHLDNLLPTCHACNTARVDPYEFHKDGTPRKRAY